MEQMQKQIDELAQKLDRQPSPDIERLNAMMELLIAKMMHDKSS